MSARSSWGLLARRSGSWTAAPSPKDVFDGSSKKHQAENLMLLGAVDEFRIAWIHLELDANV